MLEKFQLRSHRNKSAITRTSRFELCQENSNILLKLLERARLKFQHTRKLKKASQNIGWQASQNNIAVEHRKQVQLNDIYKHEKMETINCHA